MKIRTFMKRAMLVTAALCMVFNMAACGSKKKSSIDESAGGEVVEGGEQYEDYVLSIMDLNYKNQADIYMQLTGATADDAAAVYAASTQELALLMEQALSVKKDVVTLALTEQMIALAKQVYSQAQYQAVGVMKENDTYTVSLSITPIDFYGTIETAFEGVVNIWNENAKNGEYDQMTESQYEQAYGEAVVSAIIPTLSNVKYGEKDTVYITLEYDANNDIYFISDEDMQALSQKVVTIVK